MSRVKPQSRIQDSLKIPNIPNDCTGSEFHSCARQSPTSINGAVVGCAKLLKVAKSRQKRQGPLGLTKNYILINSNIWRKLL